jgi:hypothetical protein
MGLLDRLFSKPRVATFAQQMIQALREAGDNTDLRFDASENRIVRGAADVPWTVNLANLSQTYLQEPRSKRAEYVRSVARGLLTPTKGLPKLPTPVRAHSRATPLRSANGWHGPSKTWNRRDRHKLPAWIGRWGTAILTLSSISATDLESLLPDRSAASHPEPVLEYRLDESRRQAGWKQAKRQSRRAAA